MIFLVHVTYPEYFGLKAQLMLLGVACLMPTKDRLSCAKIVKEPSILASSPSLSISSSDNG